MSDQITKDLGGITAYAAAVAAGYTGTKSQFETLMASYATVAQNAAASATAANGSAEDAEAFADGQRDGVDVGSDDPAYHNNAKYYAEQAEDFADSIDPDTLAKIDGYYQEMTVGDAEQIVSSILVEDKAPYKFRTAGGSVDIGKRAYFDAIVGGTVAWNQLVANAKKSDVITPSGDTTYSYTVPDISVYLLPNRVYAVSCKISYNGNKTLRKYVQCGSVYGRTGDDKDIGANQTEYTTWLIKPQANDVLAVGLSNITTADLLTSADAWSYDNFNIIDLTALLGSTIADYIYTLETANVGAGVAFFRKYFPNSYYPYNAGELVSVSGLSAHKTTGFNQWDEEWENGYWNVNTGEPHSDSSYIRCKNFIKVVPNTVYYFKAPTANNVNNEVLFFDENQNILGYADVKGNSTFTTPSNCGYIKFYMHFSYGNVYNNDICINLHWDGSRDGEYEEYKEHTYLLDDSLTLRGIPKLADGKLQFDGDEYLPDGTHKKRYGYVNLGSLNWNYTSATHTFRLEDNIGAVLPNASTVANLFCVPYTTVAQDYTLDKDKVISGLNWRYGVQIIDSSYSSADAFKTAMNGVYLVYEKATPTTEEADAYSGIQIVDDFGTEEFITDSVVPVGHVTHYPVNLVAKLEMEPNSPDGNGDYIVQQDSGINTYIPLASTDTITGIIARLEALEGGGE